jgi:methionyl-tRNA formyltransferase
MRLAVAATPEVAVPTLQWLHTSNHDLVRVISQPDRPAGRGQQVHSSPVSQWAKANSIELRTPSTISDIDVAISDVELLITIGYGRILPASTISIPKFGCINLHFSLLPKYRGAAPVQRAIEAGETESGVSVFALDPGMDTGPIFAQESITIDPSWRSFELLDQLANLGPKVVERSFAMIDAGQSPKQQIGTASGAPKISKAEAKIDFSKDAAQIANAIRAFTYEPGAWTLWKGESFKICSSKVTEPVPGAPGQVTVIDKAVIVSTGTGAIEFLRVIPAGKNEMDAIDWARGARLTGGEIFG